MTEGLPAYSWATDFQNAMDSESGIARLPNSGCPIRLRLLQVEDHDQALVVERGDELLHLGAVAVDSALLVLVADGAPRVPSQQSWLSGRRTVLAPHFAIILASVA